MGGAPPPWLPSIRRRPRHWRRRWRPRTTRTSEENERQYERDEYAHRGYQVSERDSLGEVLVLGLYAFGEVAMRQQPESTR
jgi:hypothetical protein